MPKKNSSPAPVALEGRKLEKLGEMLEEHGICSPRLAMAPAVKGKRYMSAKEVRAVLALLLPYLANKFEWDSGDIAALAAIFGMQRRTVDECARNGTSTWARYFRRVQNTFLAATMWLESADIIQFFSTPNRTIGGRPIDYLRRGDCSFRLMVDEIARECGTDAHLIEDVLPRW